MKNGVQNIKAAAYNCARTVIEIEKKIVTETFVLGLLTYHRSS